MSFAICQLCRAKVYIEPGAVTVRCHKCGGKIATEHIRESLEKAGRRSGVLACAGCLKLFPEQMLMPLSTCPNCGSEINFAKSDELVDYLDGLEQRVTAWLVAGEPASNIVRRMASDGVNSSAAWNYVDRLIAELPFERQLVSEENDGGGYGIPTCCDSCGIVDPKSQFYSAVWSLEPSELKRYHSGYAGFDGEFISGKTYERKAIYFLCSRCAKVNRSPQFANGYPYDQGFRMDKLKRIAPPKLSK